MRSDNSISEASSPAGLRDQIHRTSRPFLKAAAVAISLAPLLSACAQDAALPGWTSVSRANETEYTHGETRALLVLRDLPALVGRPLAEIFRTFSGALRTVCRQLEAAPIATDAGGAMAVRFDGCSVIVSGAADRMAVGW